MGRVSFFYMQRPMPATKLSLRASAHTGVGRRAVRRQWQMKHGERVAAVKISVALIPLRNLGHRNRKSVSGPLV